MRIKYSKQSDDVAVENKNLVEFNAKLLEEQRRTAQTLRAATVERKICLLCKEPLDKVEAFHHREVFFRQCSNCEHIQSQFLPPEGYPFAQGYGDFEMVYPKLESADFESRKNRIYVPKLNWILEALSAEKLSLDRDRDPVVELGCGAGYFLRALEDQSFQKIVGFERNASLVESSKRFLNQSRVIQEEVSPRSFETQPAKLYAAFFVFEHFGDFYSLNESLQKLPPGTLLAFSVPTLGFATLLENLFTEHFARNFDGVLHAQLFTEKSIHSLLKNAGFKLFSQWIFGQDALDLMRLLSLKMSAQGSGGPMPRLLAECRTKLMDSFQSLVDQNHLTEARHLLAIKI